MVRVRIVGYLLFSALGICRAQTVHVLQVPRPPDYKERHQSDEVNLSVSYAGRIQAHTQIYVRIFLDNVNNLRRQASALSASKCVDYKYFWRKPLSITDDGLMIDTVIKIFRNGTQVDQDFTLVFEEGEESSSGNDDLKLSKKGVSDYFKFALPVHIYASPVDQVSMYKRAQPIKPSLIAQIVDKVVPPVLAQNRDTMPIIQPTISIVDGPCRVVNPIPLIGAPILRQDEAQGINAPFIPTITLTPVLELAARRCGG